MTAGENLTSTVLAAGVGQLPGDRAATHPEFPRVKHTVASEDFDAIVRFQRYLFESDAPPPAREHLPRRELPRGAPCDPALRQGVRVELGAPPQTPQVTCIPFVKL